jgi:hypothetical protein
LLGKGAIAAEKNSANGVSPAEPADLAARTGSTNRPEVEWRFGGAIERIAAD